MIIIIIIIIIGINTANDYKTHCNWRWRDDGVHVTGSTKVLGSGWFLEHRGYKIHLRDIRWQRARGVSGAKI
jgi:hypothetical protein